MSEDDSLLWIRQTDDDTLVVVHKHLGIVARDMTLYTACKFINNWPDSFIEEAKKLFGNDIILLLNEVT